MLVRGKEDGAPGASQESLVQRLAAWQHAEGSLRHLSSNEAYIVAEQSGHAIQRDAPRLVVSAIQEVVEAARLHRVVDRRTIMARAK